MHKFRSIKHNVRVSAKNNSSDATLEAEMILDENVRPLQRLNHRVIRLRRDLGDLFPGKHLPAIPKGSARVQGPLVLLLWPLYLLRPGVL